MNMEADRTMKSNNILLRNSEQVIEDDSPQNYVIGSSQNTDDNNDQFIRPERNQSIADGAADSHCESAYSNCKGIEGKLTTRNGLQVVKASEDNGLHENDELKLSRPNSYGIVSLKTECSLFPLTAIVFRNEVFFSQTLWDMESCDTDIKDDEYENPKIGTQKESFVKSDTRKDEQHFYVIWIDKLQSKLLLKGERHVKASGKRQRRKKLTDLLGVCDTFRYFEPAPVCAAMFPVSRQSRKEGQSSQGARESSKEPLPPPQPPPGDNNRKGPSESVYGLPWETFRQELSRLGTFMDMPANSPVFAVRLAQAGFLRYPDGAIICFFCGLQRDEWNAGDNPVEIHRRLRGNCPMVTGGECENQPVVITLPEERLQELMAVWSLSGPSLVQGREPAHQQRGVEVADATATASQPTQTTSRASNPSAYSTGRGPTARAADLAADGHPPASGAGSAGAQASAPPDRRATPAAAAANPSISGASPLSAPAVGNNSAQARDQLPPRMGLMGGDVASANPGAPRGPIFDGTAQPEPPRNPADNISASGSEPRAGQQVVTYQQLGIVTEAPKRSDMAMLNSRVGSFRNWPATASHTPLQLAEAGFFYAGYADCGRCFFCGGGLKNWEPVDNAWVEHARWFAKCAYIRQCQGQDFIDVVQELNVDRCPISLDQVTAEINRRRADGERIQEPVVDPAVSSILELGVRPEDINSAVLRVQREGHLVTADRLLDTLQAEGVLAAGGADDASSISDSELGQVEELITENSAIREQRMCKICLDKESCIVFLPCGHLVSCAECSPALKHCPMCRQRVKGRVRAFPA